MHGFWKFLREIHHRSLWQAVGLYLAGAWVAFEGVSRVTEWAGLPEWTEPFAAALLFLGLPVVAATAFVQHGLPGLRGEYRDEVDPNELEGLTPDQVHRIPSAYWGPGSRLFTWRNAVLGGVGAATLLITSVLAYVGLWAAGIGPMGNLVAQGVVHRGDLLVVADFHDETRGGMGRVVTDALRVDLSQGDILHVVPARDAASRGRGVTLEGGVSASETGYRITAVMREMGSRRELASFRVAADDREGIIAAVDRLSEEIREKTGESLRHIRTAPSLGVVTTESFEALRLYSEANAALGAGDRARAVELALGALAVDSAFARAWVLLGSLHEGSGGDPEAALRATSRAYLHRDRLTESEREQLQVQQAAEGPGADR